MHRSRLTTGGAVSLFAGVLSTAAVAQEGGLQMVFGFENRLEVTRNPGLDVPATGTRVQNVTALSFGLLSETPIDRFEFNATGAILITNPEDASGTDVDVGRPALTFGYRREVPSALLELAANYRSDDVEVFDDGIEDDDSVGTRTEYGASARLEVGRTSPLGFAAGAGFDVTEYDDTVDPDLVDTRTARADVAAILRFSEVLTGRLGLRYQRQEDDDAATTVTETLGATAGLDYTISPRLDLGVEVAFEQTDTEEFGVVDRTDGPEARVNLTYDMANGTLTADLRLTTDADEGDRTTFEVGRTMEFPATTLSGRLGVTQADATGTDVIGALDWARTRPDGSIGLSLERTVSYDADDDETVTSTTFSLRVAQRVNETSEVSLDMSYALQDAASERIEQTDIGAVYSKQLTADWSLNGGVGYRLRNDADGHAESPRVFLSISRDFNLRP